MGAIRYWWAVGVGFILSGVASPAFGAAVYSSEGDFLARVQSGYYVERFSSYTYGDPLTGDPDTGPCTVEFSGGSNFKYEAFASQGLFSLPGALSTNFALDVLTITFTGAPVTAVGGNFYATDVEGNVLSTNVVVQLQDNPPVTLSNPDAMTFTGFLSAVPITGIIIDGLEEWPTVDNFCVGTVFMHPPQGGGVVTAPLPAAVWAGLTLLGGLALAKLGKKGRLGSGRLG